MVAPAHLVRRSRASALIALLAVPLLGALHQHRVDHDGATRHIEHAHGGHTPTLVETDDRLTSGSVRVPVAAAAARGFDLDATPCVLTVPTVLARVCEPGRGPPGARRSRAPPRLT